MAKKKAAPKKGLSLRIKRNAFFTLLILLVLYIGVHVLSRTEGFRSMVADKISNATRQPVALKACGATPLLGLRLEGLTFYGVEMPEVKACFNLLSGLSRTLPLIRSLTIYSPEIKLKRIPASGNWEPLVLHGIGSRLGAVVGVNPLQPPEEASLPKFPDHVLNTKTLLRLSRAKVSWRDEKGRELAYITGADLKVKTGGFIGRKVVQSIVSCEHIRLASGQMLRDFRLEAFRYQNSDIVTILDMADSDGEYPEFATASLWQDLNEQLNTLSKL